MNAASGSPWKHETDKLERSQHYGKRSLLGVSPCGHARLLHRLRLSPPPHPPGGAPDSKRADQVIGPPHLDHAPLAQAPVTATTCAATTSARAVSVPTARAGATVGADPGMKVFQSRPRTHRPRAAQSLASRTFVLGHTGDGTQGDRHGQSVPA